MSHPYRTDARTIALEHVATTARAFPYALATDPGWPEKRRKDLEHALDAIPPEPTATRQPHPLAWLVECCVCGESHPTTQDALACCPYTDYPAGGS